jgi:hypothetical protein
MRPVEKIDPSMKYLMSLAIAVVMLSSTLAARAQGIPDGIAYGAYVGNNTAGPVGAVVGGAVGGVVGGFEGALGFGPRYVAYPDGGAPASYRSHRVRHSYHRVHPYHSRG